MSHQGHRRTPRSHVPVGIYNLPVASEGLINQAAESSGIPGPRIIQPVVLPPPDCYVTMDLNKKPQPHWNEASLKRILEDHSKALEELRADALLGRAMRPNYEVAKKYGVEYIRWSVTDIEEVMCGVTTDSGPQG